MTDAVQFKGAKSCLMDPVSLWLGEHPIQSPFLIKSGGREYGPKRRLVMVECVGGGD